MKSAQAVYVFPVKPAAKPRRDDKHLRLLDQDSRHKLLLILGTAGNWWNGLLTIVERLDQPTNVGFLFQTGRDELVLFFREETVEGRFRGRQLLGALTQEETENGLSLRQRPPGA